MDIAIRSSASGVSIGAAFRRELIQLAIKSSNAFMQWQRQELLEKDQTPETVKEHLDTVTYLLRNMYILHGLASDFPERAYAAEIQGKIRQLEESRDTIHDPMTEEEADAILKKVIPDEPAVQKNCLIFGTPTCTAKRF